jgi:ketosteroid isomerase-like protein
MSASELANTFIKAVIAEDAATYQALWSDDIVSIEPNDGPMSRVEGRAALLEKHAWWAANATVHSTTVEGPYVCGDQFAVHFGMDVTIDGTREQMQEVAIYTVENGRIVEERFFYGEG